MSWFRRLLRTVTGKDPERAALLSRRGDELAAEGSFTEAAEAYEESIRLGEFDRTTYFKLARAYLNAYEPQKADAAMRRLIEADPENSETYREVIRFYLSRGSQRLPEDVAQRYLALKTKDSNYYLAKSYCAYLHYWTQGAVERPAVVPEVIESAEESIRLDPTNADAYFLLAWGLIEKGQGEYRETEKGHWVLVSSEEIMRALEKCLEHAPDHVEAASLLIRLYSGAGRYEDTIALCRRLIRLNPSDNYPLFLIAESYAHLGRFQETIDAMSQALKSQEGARLSLGGYRSSIETLKLVAESDTDLSRVRSACLFASYASGLFSRTAYKWDSPSQGDEAAADCLRWYEKSHTYPADLPDSWEWQIHYCAGGEYLREQRYAEARDALLKSVELHPDTYEVYEVSNRKYRRSPLELLSEYYVQVGLSEQARGSQRRHVEMIRRTGEHMREQILALEAQPPGSYAPWRLSSLSAFHRWCAEYEAEATRKLSML